MAELRRSEAETAKSSQARKLFPLRHGFGPTAQKGVHLTSTLKERRSFTPEFKRRVVEECLSVSTPAQFNVPIF